MCWKCGKPIDTAESIYRGSLCPECGADLHCCRNCSYYAPGAHYDCRETVVEFVADKETANFCNSFTPKSSFEAKGIKENNEAEKARDAFNSLFGGIVCI
jgi:hypothetical protein